MAQQSRSWEFDLEEGVLDSARLARVVIDAQQPLSLKQEKEMAFRDTSVTLLIDTGSMRGRPTTARDPRRDLARTLERRGVKVEILGFTTRAWKGGQSREPGFRPASPPTRPAQRPAPSDLQGGGRARRRRENLGLMMREARQEEHRR